MHKLILENKYYLKLMLTYCLVIFFGFGLTSYLVTTNMAELLTGMESRFDSEVIQKVQNFSDDRYQDINSIFARLYQKQYFNNNSSVVDFINPAREAQRNNNNKSVAITGYLQDTCSANAAIADILLIDYHDRDVYFCSNIHNRDVSIDYDFFRYDFIGDGIIRNQVEIVPNYIPDYISSASINNFPIISYQLFLFDENAIRFTEPLGMAVILAMLQSFEAEAEAMEASRISPVAMAGRDLPDNVIRLAEKLHKQGVRVGVPGGVA